jgi:uncharacterized Tic20 family protein
MKGLKGIDPERGENHLAQLLAAIGWIIMLASVLGALLDWVAR